VTVPDTLHNHLRLKRYRRQISAACNSSMQSVTHFDVRLLKKLCNNPGLCHIKVRNLVFVVKIGSEISFQACLWVPPRARHTLIFQPALNLIRNIPCREPLWMAQVIQTSEQDRLLQACLRFCFLVPQHYRGPNTAPRCAGWHHSTAFDTVVPMGTSFWQPEVLLELRDYQSNYKQIFFIFVPCNSLWL